MDFSNRNPQSAPHVVHPGAQASPVSSNNHRGSKSAERGVVYRTVTGVLLAAVIILIIALVAFIGFGGNSNEDKFVIPDRLQAVFLNTGQVYFGNIKALNSKYYDLTNIYYLQTSGSSSSTTTTASSANSSVSLVKLGCELHAPYDQMIINAQQVTFWENLQPSGQVAKAVQAFQKANPDGQKCSDQSSASSGTGSTTTGVQGATGTGDSTTATPATTTKSATTPATTP